MECNIYPKNKETICRFCLKLGEITSFDIFENEYDKFSEILNFLSVNITHDKHLPNRICYECKVQLGQMLEFKNMIIKNELLLKQHYDENKYEISMDDSSDVLDYFNDNEEFFKHVDEKTDSGVTPLVIEVTTAKELNTNIKKSKETKKAKTSIEKCNICNKNVKAAFFNKHKTKCEIKFKPETPIILEAETEKHICNICGNIFDKNVRLCLHYIHHVLCRNDTNHLFIFCNYCGLVLNNNEELSNHIKERHKTIETIWSCDKCDINFSSELDLIDHIHSANNNHIVNFNSNICLICNEEIKGSLSIHLKTHLMKRHKCLICEEKYITSVAYSNHLQVHPQYKYKCEFCHGMFLSKKNVDKHVKEIHNRDHFICEVCSKVFNRKHNLYLHKKQKHDGKNKNFVCSICAFATSNNSELRKHERLHSDERPYKCTFNNCEKSYKTSSHLCHHVKTHLNLRNFLCEYCDKSFYTSKNLKHHILAHTGVKDFKCNFCDNAFKRRDQLTAHIKRHGFINQ